MSATTPISVSRLTAGSVKPLSLRTIASRPNLCVRSQYFRALVVSSQSKFTSSDASVTPCWPAFSATYSQRACVVQCCCRRVGPVPVCSSCPPCSPTGSSTAELAADPSSRPVQLPAEGSRPARAPSCHVAVEFTESIDGRVSLTRLASVWPPADRETLKADLTSFHVDDWVASSSASFCGLLVVAVIQRQGWQREREGGVLCRCCAGTHRKGSRPKHIDEVSK